MCVKMNDERKTNIAKALSAIKYKLQKKWLVITLETEFCIQSLDYLKEQKIQSLYGSFKNNRPMLRGPLKGWSLKLISFEVQHMFSKATVPVNQIQQDDDDGVITVTTGGLSHSGSFSPSVNVVSSGSGSLTGPAYGSGASNIYSVNSIQSMVGQSNVDLSYNQSPELPAVVFNGYDFDEKKIVMTLKPESTISTLEVFKILMLINATVPTPRALSFSVFAYIKKNNLERHFKFAQ